MVASERFESSILVVGLDDVRVDALQPMTNAAESDAMSVEIPWFIAILRSSSSSCLTKVSYRCRSCFSGSSHATHARSPFSLTDSEWWPLAPTGTGLIFYVVFYFDPLYLVFFVPGLLLSLWASSRTKSTFRKYSQVPNRHGYTGADAARELIRQRGIAGVHVEETPGFLSDHYDPTHRVLRLSPDVYHGRSLAAMGVAAHEAGHAIQHAKSYGPLKFRSLVVKPATIGSNLGTIIAGIGLFLQSTSMIWVGIILFSAFVLFTLVTLPVEFDASRRAVVALQDLGMIDANEVDGAAAVLKAAAMTYVAAAVTAILQLLYFILRARE